MILVVSLAAVAAASVLLYARWREQQPELADLSARRAQQLAAVMTVLSGCVQGVLEVLTYARPQPAMARGQRLVDMWDDES